MVLLGAALIVVILLIGSELYYEDPSVRQNQYRIAQQTAFLLNTQSATHAALQQTVQASVPMQTQYAAMLQYNNLLMATYDAYMLGTVIAITPTNIPQITAVADQPQTIESNSVISSGIDSNGCAVDSRIQFPITGADDPTAIYFSTVVRNVTAGTTFRTRWYNTADDMSRYESIAWQADRAYDETCVYFWMESSDIPYTFGSWTVELIINDAIAESLQFTLCEIGSC